MFLNSLVAHLCVSFMANLLSLTAEKHPEEEQVCAVGMRSHTLQFLLLPRAWPAPEVRFLHSVGGLKLQASGSGLANGTCHRASVASARSLAFALAFPVSHSESSTFAIKDRLSTSVRVDQRLAHKEIRLLCSIRRQRSQTGAFRAPTRSISGNR